MKRKIWIISSIIATTTPVATMISCGDHAIKISKEDSKSSDEKFAENEKQTQENIKNIINQLMKEKNMPIIQDGNGQKFATNEVKLSQVNPQIFGFEKSFSNVILSVDNNIEKHNDSITLHINIIAPEYPNLNQSYEVDMNGFASESATTKDILISSDQLNQIIDQFYQTKENLNLLPNSQNKEVSLVKNSDFVIKNLGNSIFARVTKITPSLSQDDTVSATVEVGPISPIAGVKSQTYEMVVRGFLPNRQLAAKKYAPIQLSSLPQDGMVWAGGPSYTAYVQAGSYLRNLAEKLGWQSKEEHDVVVPQISTNNGPINVEGYTNGVVASTLEKTIVQTQLSDTNYKNFPGQNGYLHGLMSSWGTIKHLTPAEDGNVVGAFNHMQGKLPNDFASKDNLTKLKEVWATLSGKGRSGDTNHYQRLLPTNPPAHADTILFKIDETTNTLHAWFAGSAAAAQAEHDKMAKLNDLLHTSVHANPAQGVRKISDAYLWLDPAGGKEKPHPATISVVNYDFSAWGNAKGNGNWDNISFAHWGSWIDGDHPGQLKIKFWISNTNVQATYVSPANAFPIFETLTGDKETEALDVIYSLIKNLKTNIKVSSLNMVSGKVNNDFVDMLKYLITTPFEDDQIKAAFYALNNGSHYFPAIEVFAKGITGLTNETTPHPVLGSVQNGTITGMSSTTDMMDILKWATKIAHDNGNGIFYYNPMDPSKRDAS